MPFPELLLSNRNSTNVERVGKSDINLFLKIMLF